MLPKLIKISLIALVQTVAADNIAIFYALDKDLSALASPDLKPVRQQSVGDRTIHFYEFEDHTIATIKMRSGQVETAISAQALLAIFRADFAISIGPMAAFDESVEQGEIFYAKKVVNYQSGVATNSGVAPNESDHITLLPPQHIIAAIEQQFERSITGISIASGELFVSSEEFRNELKNQYGTSAVEMNLFALSKALASHQVPSLHLRVVSDHGNSSASSDFREFVEEYEGELGSLVASLISDFPSNPTSPNSYEGLKRLLGQ